MNTPLSKTRKALRGLTVAAARAAAWLTRSPRAAGALAALLATLAGAEAIARVGGGDSYSGGSSGGGYSGGGGGSSGGGDGLFFLIWLCIEHPVIGIPLLIIVGIVWIVSKTSNKGEEWSAGQPGNAPVARVAPKRYTAIRALDPEFSPVTFEDFLYSLYARTHEARGAGRLDDLAPYLTPAARSRLIRPPGLVEVKGVIVGSMQLLAEYPPGPALDRVRAIVKFEANYTEVYEHEGRRAERARYAVERWSLSRKAGVMSKPPAKAKVLGCPNCGAALQAVRGETCSYCNAVVKVGDFDWGVDGLEVLAAEDRPPAFAVGTQEKGTSLPTVVDPAANEAMQQLAARDPEVSFQAIQQRASMIFHELQAAWTARDWTRARPFVTDNLFQMQLYWMEAYKKQGVRNVIENVQVTSVQLAKVHTDKWFDSITVRIYANCTDYYVADDGRFLGGRRQPQPFSEYWTFIRGRSRKGAPGLEKKCPNCGAPQNINQAGVCEYCQAKVTAGDFDWVLSRIEQDESYGG